MVSETGADTDPREYKEDSKRNAAGFSKTLQTQLPPENAVHLAKARTALENGQTNEALQITTLLLKQQPRLQEAFEIQASAYLKLKSFVAAVKSCRIAEEIANVKNTGQTKTSRLLDNIACAAAAEGSLEGFDGRSLEVRCAGEDAWLGGPAPAVPHLDAPDESPQALLPDPVSNLGMEFADESRALTKRLQASFRSVKDALEAAKDGDQIILLQGVHNGMGEALSIDKRILIRGEGGCGETKIDQRANAPTFRISRTCVIQNLDLDMTGFRECVCVTGSKTVKPLLKGCIIRCSGSDAVNLTGSSSTTLRDCRIEAKRAGVRAFDRANGCLVSCSVVNCGETGLLVHDKAMLHGTRCNVSNCEQGGAVCSHEGTLNLQDCLIEDCKGPGLDLSQSSKVELKGCTIKGNVENSGIDFKDCHFAGKFDIENSVWQKVKAAGNNCL